MGRHVGEISRAAPACADDVTIESDKKSSLQYLVDKWVDFSRMERYFLQPAKSVILKLPQQKGQTQEEDI